jgi:hypothetical protein
MRPIEIGTSLFSLVSHSPIQNGTSDVKPFGLSSAYSDGFPGPNIQSTPSWLDDIHEFVDLFCLDQFINS